jgi:1-acyl-sn-glycerol-3-phosphate acyltransferase
MLTAKKSAWFETLFSVYNRNLFQRRFQALRVSGLEHLLERDKTLPLVLYANHSSWWDGLTAFEIGRAARLDHFLMMEEKHLRKLFLFRKLGAFSVVRENPRDAVKSLNYAANLLKEKPNRAIWIFPQGEILPNDIRPLKFYRGLERIIERTGPCLAAPLAMRYEFVGDFKPSIFVIIGKPELFNRIDSGDYNHEYFAQMLTATLDSLKSDILAGQTINYTNLMKRDRSN